MQTRWFLILLLVLLFPPLIILLLLWLLRQRVNHDFPFPPAYRPEEFFIDNEVVISGSASAIDDVVTGLPGGVQLERIDAIRFADFGAAALACANVDNDDPIPADYEIRLYRILARSIALEDLLALLDQESRTPAGDVVIYTELNRITGAPHDPEPSPHDPEPSPSSTLPPVFTTPDQFYPQWAFEMIRLQSFAPNNAVWSGRGVKVRVFDTSPLNLAEDRVAPDGTVTRDIRRVTVPIPAPFHELRLTGRNARNHSRLPSNLPHAPDENLRSHGLFAAGLVHAVAPQSEIKLVEVLDEDRRGTMYDLMRAVFDVLREDVPAAPSYPRPVDMVFNLSLGVRIPPPEDEFPKGAPSDLRRLAQRYPAVYNYFDACHNLFKMARCLGVVIVAAAGNDSDEFPAPLLPHFPALLAQDSVFGKRHFDPEPHVLGVASSSIARDRSCFSNSGSIAAPGGDAVSMRAPRDGALGVWQSLVSRFPALARFLEPAHLNRVPPGFAQSAVSTGKRCAAYDGGDPAVIEQISIVGPVFDPVPKNLPSTVTPRFRYWSGTSFATPIVAGLAALIISCRGDIDAQTLRDEIEANILRPPADSVHGLGKGIIRIPDCYPVGNKKAGLGGGEEKSV